MLTHNLTTLETGLPLLRIPMPGFDSVTVLALANTGSRYEAPKQFGLAHFFEHLVFKGTKKYPNPQLLASTIDGIGADFNAFTSKEYTGYFVRAAARHLELALDVVSDMLLTPLLRQTDIDREQNVIIEEIHMYKDTPQLHVGNLFDRLAFTTSGLGHDIIGSVETVSRLKTADFQAFLRQWYGLENLLLVVAGDERVVGEKQILEQVAAAFGKEDELTAGRAREKVQVREQLQTNPYTRLPKDVKKSQQSRLHVEQRQTEQAHFILGWPGLNRHDERRYAASLLGIILGGNMSSRLFSEVREKRGLAYYVRSEVDTYHDTGVLGAAAGVHPARVEEALEVTMEQFIQLVDAKSSQGQAGSSRVAAGQKNLITASELARAKEYLAGKLALQYEDSRAIAQYYGLRQLLSDKVETPEEALEKFRAVSLDEVQAVVTELIQPDKMRLAVIGPFENKEELTQLL